MAQKRSRLKGFFGDIRLPVARKYVYPDRRNAILYLGIGGGLLIAAVFAFNIVAQEGSLVSNGPLSSNHAAFGKDCAACHTPLKGVTAAQCGTCHEKYGASYGTYSFASHYAYRSGDFDRAGDPEAEQACYGCHVEHVGRDAAITRVTDAACTGCHAYGSFSTGHPEFDFAAEGLQDDAHLIFPHVRHVEEIRYRAELDVPDLEQACLYCHNAEPEGKGFQPIAFEQHCASCHLNGETTPWLSTAASPTADRPAVATPATLQRGTGARLFAGLNGNDFEASGGEIQKVVQHEDPWVLENLRRLRHVMYPDAGLADLLRTSADVAPREARALYQEALQTLRAYTDGLRAAPEDSIRADVAEADRLLRLVERRLRDPFTPLNETRFVLSIADRNPALDADRFEAYTAFIDELTQPCQKCHRVADATLLRVEPDQKKLERASFDHSAHIISTGCLDCHNTIPFAEFVDTGVQPEAARDHAGLFNLPTLDTCQSCHKPAAAASTCITCHDFHPDKTQHANLLRYIE